MATIFIFNLITTIDKNLYVIYNIFHNQGVFIMSNENQKDNKENFLTKFLKAIHEYYIFSFIFLFSLSIIIFAIIYICHSKNIENRFNRTLQNYEKLINLIFENAITDNGSNENIYSAKEDLKLSFEVGFKMLESSINEIMKNSNDILQFWFAFLSVIMIVFTIIGFFLNNNILNQTTKQLEIVKIKSKDYINKIKRNAKTENNELIKNIKSKSEEETNKLIQKLESEYNQTIEKFKEENNELIENIKIKTNEETEKLIKELEDKYNEAIKDINKRGKEEGRKIEEESDKKIQENELFNFGLQSVNIKDYKSAIYYFTEVIKLNPKNSIAYNNRGNAKSDLSNTKEKNSEEYNKLINEAIEDYNKAIELNPNLSEAYNNRGNAKSDLSNTKEKNSEEYNKLINEAIEDYNKAIELNQYYVEAYNNRGIAKAKLKLFEEAIEDYNKTIELNPNFDMGYNNVGATKYDLANTKEKDSEEYNKLMNEAIEDYNKSIELNINNYEAYYNRGEAKSILANNKEKNNEEYNKLINEAYNDFKTSYNFINNELKKEIEKQLINLAKEKNEAAIKFCEEHNIDYKNYKE